MRATRIILTFGFMLAAFCASAQFRLAGMVVDSATRKPLPDASIYIANTTAGTKTNAEGRYQFSNLLPNNYTLLVRYVGYDTKQVDVSLTKDNDDFTITLSAKSIAIPEVIVRSGADWAKNLALFKRDFLGTTNENECRILNQEVLNLKFDRKTNILRASSDDFLDIENYVLGYKLRFLVREFWANYDTYKTHYNGNVIFEPLRGDYAAQDRWKQNRIETYDGSFRHFLTTLNPAYLGDSKFIVRRLIRTPNPTRPPDSVIVNKIKLFADQIKNGSGNHANDSLTKWTSLSARPRLNSTLGRDRVGNAEFVKPSEQQGINSLQFDGSLYIIYKGKPEKNYYSGLYRFSEADTWQISAFNLNDAQKPLLFNNRGIELNRGNLFLEGAWGSTVVKLLPDDYIPNWYNN